MPKQLIPTTHVPEGAYVVTVSRRPDQGFVTLDASVLQQETSRFDRLGWKYEVRQLGLTAATVTYNVQAAATSLLEALSQLCLAAEDIVPHREPDSDPEERQNLTSALDYADRVLAPFRTLSGEGEALQRIRLQRIREGLNLIGLDAIGRGGDTEDLRRWLIDQGFSWEDGELHGTTVQRVTRAISRLLGAALRSDSAGVEEGEEGKLWHLAMVVDAYLYGQADRDALNAALERLHEKPAAPVPVREREEIPDSDLFVQTYRTPDQGIGESHRGVCVTHLPSRVAVHGMMRTLGEIKAEAVQVLKADVAARLRGEGGETPHA